MTTKSVGQSTVPAELPVEQPAELPVVPAEPAAPASPAARSVVLRDDFERGQAPAALRLATELPSMGAAPALAAPEPSGVSVRPRGLVAGSILNPGGMNNVNGADPLWAALPDMQVKPDDRGPRLDDRNLVADPNAVVTRTGASSGDARIHQILLTHEGAPRTGELIATELLRLYGPYNAQNSPENLRRIEENLAWIENTSYGLKYETPRASSNATDTYPPNKTLSIGTGICRDIHLATTAVHAALMNAQSDGKGGWVIGPPTGREDSAQNITFNNPNEYHAFRAFKNPLTGKWKVSEYGKIYDIEAPNALDAFRSVVGHLSGMTRYTIRGWDANPTVNDRAAIGAVRANSFFEGDVGTGVANETRVSASANRLAVAHFVTQRFAVVGEVDPEALNNGLRAGLKLNYHEDIDRLGAKGYIHVAGGVYNDFFDASTWTGERGAQYRSRYNVFVLAIQTDGRYEGEPKALVDEHLKATWGTDWNARLGVPIGSGGQAQAGILAGGLGDYSAADVGGDVGLMGKEQLAERLTFDWAVRARARVDLVNAGTEYITSQGETARQGLLRDPLRTNFAMALTYTGDKSTTRFEVGGTQFLAAPYDRETTPSATHYAALTINAKSGLVNFGILAKGETLDNRFIAVDSLGVALNLTPRKNLEFGLGVQSVLPGGDLRQFGDHVQVTGSLKIKF